MKPILQHYLEEFDQFKNNLSQIEYPSRLEKRQQALEVFLKKGFPTPKEESWAGIAKAPFLKQTFHVAKPLEASQLTALVLPKLVETSTLRFVFVNGYFSRTLSTDLNTLPQGLHVETFEQYNHRPPENVNFIYNAQALSPLHAFAAMNQAFNQNGIMIQIDDYQIIEPLIELCFIDEFAREGFTPSLIASHHQIRVGKKAQARFLERYQCLNDLALSENIPAILRNIVIELKLSEDTQVVWAQKVEATQSYNHVAELTVLQKANSHLSIESLVEGGGLIAQMIPVFLRGEKAKVQLKNLSLGKEEYNINHHVIIHHEASHTSSAVDYRGIADHQSRIGFRGEVQAEKGLIEVNATQSSRNLLLSDQAVIDTQPRLELFTGDLVCTHGATVGSLDKMALFYLQTRGLSKEKARMLLIEAFSQTLLNKMSILSRAG